MMDFLKSHLNLDETMIAPDWLSNELPQFVKNNLTFVHGNLFNECETSRALFLCEMLVDYSWEMVNTNVWLFVEDVWRLVYGYSLLYKIVLLSFRAVNTKLSSNEQVKFNDKLTKLCDLGLFIRCAT